MTTVHRLAPGSQLPAALVEAFDGGRDYPPYLAFTKGAVDSLLEVSSELWAADSRPEPLDGGSREKVSASNARLAKRGIRVLAVGLRPLSSPAHGDEDALERDLIFLGMVGMIDPARPEAGEAVATCKWATIP